MSEEGDPDFQKRREAARARLDDLPGNTATDNAGRNVFFKAVYENANGDEAAIPWADLAPKPHLLDWLSRQDGTGKKALDIACGLGDNAEAIAAKGYATTAFDVVEKAILWAGRRFPDSVVDYQVGDLFKLATAWREGFDLVHECYTLQALPPEILLDTMNAICAFVAAGGTLLLYTRTRADGATAEGPPWPLEERFLDLPAKFGLIKKSDERFHLIRGDKCVPHSFAVWWKAPL